jgi:hypothetical protein
MCNVFKKNWSIIPRTDANTLFSEYVAPRLLPTFQMVALSTSVYGLALLCLLCLLGYLDLLHS